MSQDQITRTQPISFRQAFEAEHARRDEIRREKEEAERVQQEADLARAEQLYESLLAERAFLDDKGLVLHHRRYTVTLEHPDFRIAAYFEAGSISVTAADKRTATTPTAAPRKHETVHTVEEALTVMAQFLADETH